MLLSFCLFRHRSHSLVRPRPRPVLSELKVGGETPRSIGASSPPEPEGALADQGVSLAVRDVGSDSPIAKLVVRRLCPQ
jgi:hypothetical protein